jgi:regulatory protein
MNDMIKEAKLKALSLLNYTDRTEFQLRQKLKEKSFSEDAIEHAVEYVKSFGYVNDKNYAERYILNRQNSKSKKEIFAALIQKGIGKDDIEAAMEICYETHDEIAAIQRLCEKKHISPEESCDDEKRRMYHYLLRKGFRSDDVCKVLKVEK